MPERSNRIHPTTAVLMIGGLAVATSYGLLATIGYAQSAPPAADEPEPSRPNVAIAVQTDRETAEAAEPALSPLGLPCELSITVTEMPGAMVALDVMEPCQPDARVEIEHAGLTLTGRTDALGLMTMDIPAFETPAFFTVSLPDGSNDTALVGVPDLNRYDRVAVVWSGDLQLELHAFEMGAEFGGPGHVWEEAPGELADLLTQSSGTLVELGSGAVDDPMLAQVYSFPRETLVPGDSVRLSVDAPITAANCGQPVEARTLEVRAGGSVEITPLSLTLPGCDAVGDYLVLQNVLGDLRLAAN